MKTPMMFPLAVLLLSTCLPAVQCDEQVFIDANSQHSNNNWYFGVQRTTGFSNEDGKTLVVQSADECTFSEFDKFSISNLEMKCMAMFEETLDANDGKWSFKVGVDIKDNGRFRYFYSEVGYDGSCNTGNEVTWAGLLEKAKAIGKSVRGKTAFDIDCEDPAAIKKYTDIGRDNSVMCFNKDVPEFWNPDECPWIYSRYFGGGSANYYTYVTNTGADLYGKNYDAVAVQAKAASSRIASRELQSAAWDSKLFELIVLAYEDPATKELSEEQQEKVAKALQMSLDRQAKGKTGKRLKLFIKVGGISPPARRLLKNVNYIDIAVIPQDGEDVVPTNEDEKTELKAFIASLVTDPNINDDLASMGDDMSGYSFMERPDDDNARYY